VSVGGGGGICSWGALSLGLARCGQPPGGMREWDWLLATARLDLLSASRAVASE
jgi:hypothetical protein